eukprot:TRINITY_DN20164_c0_g1_i1.p1 TRINITY_DN20164_c0_g1~~TRINITY_DN20164_c0_g1_i1.p1  ORF type:complete len:638 (+),score=135.42 TRINITY_DN20164_c0_g1_i1:98-2011(+)
MAHGGRALAATGGGERPRRRQDSVASNASRMSDESEGGRRSSLVPVPPSSSGARLRTERRARADGPRIVPPAVGDDADLRDQLDRLSPRADDGVGLSPIAGSPTVLRTGDNNDEEISIPRTNSGEYSCEWMDEFPGLDFMSDQERRRIELQVEALTCAQRLHAVFDADTPPEEVFADRHPIITRTLFFTSFSMILISVAVFTIESLPEFYQRDLPVFFWIETVCIGWFTLELGVRFCTCRQRGAFCRHPLNVIDFAAIVPYYLSLVLRLISGGSGGGSDGLVILRVVRLTRVFRVFKLSKYDEGVQVVAQSLRRSTDALSLLIFLTALAMVLFGSTIFYAEQSAATWNATSRVWTRKPEYGGPSEKHKINSIPIGFWWCLVTLTTVGYGDMFPVTLFGYIVGVLAMMAGLLIVAFPIIIIGANFTEARLQYKDRKRQMQQQANSNLGGAASRMLAPALATSRVAAATLAHLPIAAPAPAPSASPGEGSFSGNRRLRSGLRSAKSGLSKSKPDPSVASKDGGNSSSSAAAGSTDGPPTVKPPSGLAEYRFGGRGSLPPEPPHPPSTFVPPPSGAPGGDAAAAVREAAALAQQLMQRVDALERHLGEVVRETVREELARAGSLRPVSPETVGKPSSSPT